MTLSRALVFLCLVVSVGAQKNHRVTCHLNVFSPRICEGPCSHIIIPPARTTDSFDLQRLSEDDYEALRKMKERKPALKIFVGLEVEATRLELMFTNEARVENFTLTVTRYLRTKHLDGLDLTWMNNVNSNGSSSSTELLTNFLKRLRGAFVGDDDRSLLLSVSLSEQSERSDAAGHEQTLSQYVDFISILPDLLEKDGSHINGTVQRWQEQQVNLEKLNVAIPAFLRRSYRRHHHHKNHLSSNDTNSEEEKKCHIHGVGLKLANQVCQAVKSGQEKFITLTSLSDEGGVVEEVSWLLQKGFGGVDVVFIDPDIFYKNVCANITQDKRAIIESKMVHHGSRGHGSYHHRRNHHHSHGDHHPDVPHGRHDDGHHHHSHGDHHHHPDVPHGGHDDGHHHHSHGDHHHHPDVPHGGHDDGHHHHSHGDHHHHPDVPHGGHDDGHHHHSHGDHHHHPDVPRGGHENGHHHHRHRHDHHGHRHRHRHHHHQHHHHHQPQPY